MFCQLSNATVKRKLETVHIKHSEKLKLKPKILIQSRKTKARCTVAGIAVQLLPALGTLIKT